MAQKIWQGRLPILMILVLCFALRRGLFPQVINRYNLLPETSHWEKSVDGWLDIAKTFALGKGYQYPSGRKSAKRGPVYPVFLASILWLFGLEKGLPIALTMQMVLESVTCFIIWKTAGKLFGCQYTGLLAAFLWAIYAPAMVLNLSFYSEPLFTLLLCLFSLHMLFIKENLHRLNFFSGGVLLGLTVLCRPITLFFPLVLLPVLIFHFRKQLKAILLGSFWFSFGFCLMLSPWAIRNYRMFKVFVPSSTMLGHIWYYNQIEGEDLPGDRFFQAEGNLIAPREYFDGADFSKKNEAEKDRMLRRAAWELIKSNPYRYLIVCLKRLKIIWLNLGSPHTPFLRRYLVLIFNAPLILLFLSSFIFWGNRMNFICVIPLLLILYNTAGHMLVQASWRYNIPIMPYVLIFSAYSMVGRRRKLWPEN
ncbi:MAG: glycosyltransferase family 39 protein [bacterium]